MDPSEKRDVVYKVASALKAWERVLNSLCVACLMEAKAEAGMLMLGLGNMDLAKRRLEQARKKIAVCPATAYMAELIDYSLKMLDRGEYGKAVELIEHIIDSLFAIRPEELVKCA
jgi:hypothetical protein